MLGSIIVPAVRELRLEVVLPHSAPTPRRGVT